MPEGRDHGGGLDAAVAVYGGVRAEWLDLSTGINPVPYPVGKISADAWTALPDSGAMDRLLAAARRFWAVPEHLDIVAANGASALIAAIPHVWTGQRVAIPGPTYNEHRAAFEANGWTVNEDAPDVRVMVHPNNPDGRVWTAQDLVGPCVVDESFCDVCPDASLLGVQSDQITLKSFGKFWGLAGARLGFAICTPEIAMRLRDQLGPWAVAGPTLEIGTRALEDVAWAEATRDRLAEGAKRLDELVGWELVGGTDLFRTYEVPDAAAMQDKLARGHVWSRIFPYSKTWIRLGLPAPDRWDQLKAALG
ncbi:threonine-phosphate decarboxylase [Pseudooctadecabacter sp.]|uniref:threonine-phosphate decarboxylase n=1 Tax=Pseudooctadecabacter sp. TaxID=1966338 RepID=UPI0025CEDB46|nr:threonine-phosphate decarboxylase [Pseudooctadecabacter sp.]